VCATRQSTAASYEMAVIVGFHCDVISCELSWPKPAAATESSACECGNVVGLTSIHDKMQFFSSYADDPCNPPGSPNRVPALPG